MLCEKRGTMKFGIMYGSIDDRAMTHIRRDSLTRSHNRRNGGIVKSRQAAHRTDVSDAPGANTCA